MVGIIDCWVALGYVLYSFGNVFVARSSEILRILTKHVQDLRKSNWVERVCGPVV